MYNKVILISIDALRYDCASPFKKYFNIEYSNYRTTNTWTLPSHTTMLSGIVVSDLYFQKKIKDTVTKYKNLLKGVETIATVFKNYGFHTKAITGGGFMSRYFGWGDDWDEWIEAERGYGWTGEKVVINDNEFVFLHTFYIHNWFDDVPEIKKIFREGRFNLDEEGLTNNEKKLIKTKGFKAYKKRIKTLSKRLEWLSKFDKQTLIVLTSDHGELFFENDNSFHHGDFALTDDKIFRVPLYIRDFSFPQQKIVKSVYHDFVLNKIISDKLNFKVKNNILYGLQQPKQLNKLMNENLKLMQEIMEIERHTLNLEVTLKNITSSKFFKAWQFFVKLKTCLKTKIASVIKKHE